MSLRGQLRPHHQVEGGMMPTRELPQRANLSPQEKFIPFSAVPGLSPPVFALRQRARAASPGHLCHGGRARPFDTLIFRNPGFAGPPTPVYDSAAHPSFLCRALPFCVCVPRTPSPNRSALPLPRTPPSAAHMLTPSRSEYLAFIWDRFADCRRIQGRSFLVYYE